jgi:uncharacterized membrane protein HdeD (DUF308 family)
MHDDDEYSAGQFPAAMIAASGWQATLFIGTVTLILGIIVTAHPSGSLNVIAVLLGVLAIVSGIFHLIRAFDRAESNRTWQAISGLLLVVVGVVLIRHLDLTIAAIGLLIGITWIVQGVAALIGAFAGVGVIRGWWAVYGLVSLIAGIVVTASPVTSVTVLAVLLGIWFIIIGLFQVALALIVRHSLSSGQVQGRDRDRDQGPDQVPGQRQEPAQESAPGEPSPRSADRGASSQ